MKIPQVSIIIVHYNTPKLLHDCLESILHWTTGIEYEVIVVDNSALDHSAAFLPPNDERYRYIPNKENRGFGQANNQGVRSAKGRYVLLLNSDTILINNAVEIFYEWVERRRKETGVGAVGAFLRGSDGNVCHHSGRLPTVLSVLLGEFPMLSRQDRVPAQPSPELPVGYVTGAALFIDRELFLAFGGFSDKYFMYFEETDLQFRLNKKSFKSFVIAGPEIVHFEGQSYSVANRRRIEFERSRLVYLRSTTSRLGFWIFVVIFALIKMFKFADGKYSFAENLKYFSSFFRTVFSRATKKPRLSKHNSIKDDSNTW